MSDSIQYFHDVDSGYSYAIDVNFSKEALINIMHHYTEPFTIQIGLAKLHPDDQFDKKIGREVALDDLSDSEMVISSIVFEDNRAVLYFDCADRGLSICFRIHKDSDKPHLLSVSHLDALYF